MTRIAVLGGGVAGLSVGYYARRHDIPFTIYEARERLGGNCATLQHGDHRLDVGAHRFHDRDPAVTAEVRALLGADLRQISVPSLIYDGGRLIDFPLSPVNLLRSLGPCTFGRAAMQLLASRLRPRGADRSFADYALRTYGPTIADRFLLNYSNKLWGAPCSELSASIAGSRLKGLDIRSFIIESLLGKRAKTDHLESMRFYYPRGGFGRIAERMAAVCGEQAGGIQTGYAVTRLRHASGRITAIHLESRDGRRQVVLPDEVVSTLPLDRLIGMLQPAAPAAVRALARQLSYREVILVALFIARPSVCSAATVYFPAAELPFTRIYEPRNRCPQMSPAGHTSLVAEIPCQRGDATWLTSDATLAEALARRMVDIGWIGRGEVVDTLVHRIHDAYPVLRVGSEQLASRLLAYLSGLANLRISGRNGLFRYSWLHDMLRLGREIVEGYALRAAA